MPETISIRLPDGMRKQLHELSDANNNSINREVVEMIRRAIKRRSPSSQALPKGETE